MSERLHNFLFYAPTHESALPGERARRSSRSSVDLTRVSPKKTLPEEFPESSETIRGRSKSSSIGRIRTLSRRSSELQVLTGGEPEEKMISDLKAVLEPKSEDASQGPEPSHSGEDSDIFI